MSKNNILPILVGCILGSLSLSFFAALQHSALGVDAFRLRGFVVPVFFGGIVGGAVGYYVREIKLLNTKLSKRVTTLEHFLPICSNCKRIRIPDSNPNDQHSWVQIEAYISQKTSTRFSHGYCPECVQKLYGSDMVGKDD